MKILMICNTDGALYNFRRPIIKALVDLGEQVITLSDESFYFERLRSIGAEPIAIEFSRNSTSVFGNFGLMVRLYQTICQVRPDIVHNFTHKASIYGSLAAWTAGIKRIVVTITGLGTLFIRDDLKSRIFRLALILQYRIALRTVHVVFFQNPDDRNLFIRLGVLPESKAKLSNGSGIDLVEFAGQCLEHDNDLRLSILNELTLPDNGQVIVVFPARAVREKGFYEFYEAAKQVHEHSDREYIFIHIGPIDTDEEINADSVTFLSKDCGVHYIGFRQDIDQWMAGADIICLPSYREGTPRSLIEALALGKTIITTDAPGCRETVIDGWNGYLCKVGDADDLVAKLLLVDNVMLDAAPNRSRRYCEEKYDARHLIKLTLKAYHGMGSVMNNNVADVVAKN
jgi:N,N'-diacetylbacillosaminyl-diphospho-undecaprenol alpha-1,3-N-acetylgalactosaminyltransferase